MDNVHRWTDAELIRAWQLGNVAAFKVLVRRWQQPVGRLLTRLLGEEELAANLCQEVFLRVYRAGPRYRETGAFSTWLYRITLHCAPAAARCLRPTGALEQEPPTPEDSGVSRCIQQDTIQAVTRAVADLPEPLREVLVRRHSGLPGSPVL